ncbi:MAG: rod shape-determining protein MreD, partial [Acidimicrobiia bacterium]
MAVRLIRLALLLILLTVLQTAVFPHLRVAGVVPDLGLVAAVAIGVRYGPETGAAFGFAAGLASDLFLQTPLGLAALSFALTAYLVGAMQNTLARPAHWVRPAIAVSAGLVAGLLFVGLGALVGQEQLFAVHSLRTIVLAALYDGVVAVAIFPLAISVAHPR